MIVSINLIEKKKWLIIFLIKDKLEKYEDLKDDHEKKLDNLMKTISSQQANKVDETDDDDYIKSMMQSNFDMDKMSKPAQSKVTTQASPMPVQSNRIAKLLEKAYLKSIPPVNQNLVKNSVTKADIFNNRDNSCSKIELKILDSFVYESSLEFDLVTGVECVGYPVYKSENVYLYRNVLGEWCQKEMDSFQTSTECFVKCKSILLGPGKIRSPIETTLVTEFADSDQIIAKFTNHRYVCKEFLNCNSNPCLNGGHCIRSTNNTKSSSFKCLCPYYSIGNVCEKIISSCYSSPCQNNGRCKSKPYESPTCICKPEFMGNFCEKPIVGCDVNLCMNGGRCINQINQTQFECLCTKEFKGNKCETPVFDFCEDKANGDMSYNSWLIKTSIK